MTLICISSPPEGIEALAEIKANSRTYGMFADMIAEHWTNHNTLMAFAMDHGCHAIDDNSGSHGFDMPEDLNIVHLYKLTRISEGNPIWCLWNSTETVSSRVLSTAGDK